jgi:hypothetical protein
MRALWLVLSMLDPAPVVIYVHGYGTPPAIETQLVASGREAVFIAPEAPRSARESLVWNDLESLLVAVERESGRKLSRSNITVIGHSGAYRTMKKFIEHPGVSELVMLDAMYGDTRPFEQWIAKTPHARMTIVSRSTLAKARTFLSRTESFRARIEHRVVDCSHMEIVTQGVIIPELLRKAREEIRGS